MFDYDTKEKEHQNTRQSDKSDSLVFRCYTTLSNLNYLYHSLGDVSVENVSELIRIHIHAQYVNWSAGISFPHSGACPLIGSFLLGFISCVGRARKRIQMLVHWLLFSGVSYCDNRERVFMFDYDTKEKECNLIYTRGYAHLVQISLVFRCFAGQKNDWHKLATYIRVLAP
jgi:hypothetical protein